MFFNEQSDVTLYVNRLNTEESVIPYEYHHFDFCPINEENSPVENLGQVVFGERIRPGPYKIEFMKETNCEKVIQSICSTYLGVKKFIDLVFNLISHSNPRYAHEHIQKEMQMLRNGSIH